MDNQTDSAFLQPVDYQYEEELSHLDKLIGIFTKPVKTFEHIFKFPPRTIDWFLPIMLLLVLIIIMPYLLMNSSVVYNQVKQKQMERIQKSFNQKVEKGIITREEADYLMKGTHDRISDSDITEHLVSHIITMFFSLFIIFFFMSGVYFFAVTRLLKGEGEYRHVLVVSGLVVYIAIVSKILTTVVMFILNKPILDTSIGSVLGFDRTTITGFAYSRLDVFKIWGYIVLSVGLAKFFNSSSTTKYYITVFGIWILGGLLLFFLQKEIPFLRLFLDNLIV